MGSSLGLCLYSFPSKRRVLWCYLPFQTAWRKKEIRACFCNKNNVAVSIVLLSSMNGIVECRQTHASNYHQRINDTDSHSCLICVAGAITNTNTFASDAMARHLHTVIMSFWWYSTSTLNVFWCCSQGTDSNKHDHVYSSSSCSTKRFACI